MDEKIFFEIFSRNPKSLYKSYFNNFINYLNNSSNHKSHRTQKLKSLLQKFILTEDNLNLIIKDSLNKKQTLKDDTINFNFHLNENEIEFYKKNLKIIDNNNIIIQYLFDSFFNAIIFNVINSKNSFVLPNTFILNRYSIFNNIKNYFNLVLFSILMHSFDFNEIKTIKIMDEFSDCFEEILLDFVILFENEVSYEKKISFKEITKDDKIILQNISLLLKEIEKGVDAIITDGGYKLKNLAKRLILKLKPNKLVLVINDISDQLKILERGNEHISSTIINEFLNLIEIIKKIIFLIQKNSWIQELENFMFKSLESWINEINLSDLILNRDVLLEIRKITFFIKKRNLSNTLSLILSLFLKIYKNILAKFKIFSNAYPMFKPPYDLNKIDIDINVMVVREEIKINLINHSKWYRTMVISNNPLYIIKICSDFWIKTNGFPNNTFGLFSIKNNKINNILSETHGSQLQVLKKLNSTAFNINHEYLSIISTLIKSLEIRGPNSEEQRGHLSSFIESDEVEILKKFIFLVKEYDIKQIYIPWYFDSRMRIYSYSVFAPTAGRVMRGILEISYEDDDGFEHAQNNSEDLTFFQNLKDEDFNYFFNGLTLINKDLFKNLNFFKEVTGNEKINTKIFIIALANRYWKNNLNQNQDPTHLDLLKNLLKKIESGEIKLINFITLFYGEKSTTHIGLYNCFFIELFASFKNSKADSFEELLILNNFSRILFSKNKFFIQFDVSSSALVLCGLILGFKNPVSLNVSNNNFIKKDAYSTLAYQFKKKIGLNPSDNSMDSLINRGLFKKPAMTIMYGSGEKNTVDGIKKQIQLWDLNTSCVENLIENDFNKKKYFLIRALSIKIYEFLTCDEKRRSPKNKSKEMNFNSEWWRNFNQIEEKEKSEEQIFLKNLLGMFGKKKIIEPLSINDHNFNALDNIIDNDTKIENNALERIFYEDSLDSFKEMAIENLLVYGGVVWIVDEPIILAYTDQTTRILSTLTQKFIDNEKNNDEVNLREGDESFKKLELIQTEPTLKNLKSPVRFTKKQRGLETKFHRLFILTKFSFENDCYSKEIILDFLLALKDLDNDSTIKLDHKLSKEIIKFLQKKNYIKEEEPIPFEECIDSDDIKEFFDLIQSFNKEDFERLELIIIHFLNELPKFVTAFRANCIHGVDAFIARKMILSNKSNIITNHDCFYIKSDDIASSIVVYNKIFSTLEIKINNKLFKYSGEIKNNLPFFV